MNALDNPAVVYAVRWAILRAKTSIWMRKDRYRAYVK